MTRDAHQEEQREQETIVMESEEYVNTQYENALVLSWIGAHCVFCLFNVNFSAQGWGYPLSKLIHI